MLKFDNKSIKHFTKVNDFSIYIESYAIKNGVGLITSMMQYCEDADVDFHDCVPLISKSLKDKIQEEAIAQNYMPPTEGAIDFF